MRKLRLWLALVATLLATTAGAQSNLTVTAAEYFFDSDPGFGQATVINNMVEGEQRITIPTNQLSAGAHTFCIRTLASNGVWSTTMSKPIYVMHAGSEVARVEYFFDSDPGYGKGTDLTIGGATDIVLEIPTIDITPGAHMFYIRTQDTNGQWSTVMARPIYVFTTLPIAALEYYIDDNDPGEGKATAVTVPTATSALVSFDIDCSTLTPGEHTLNVRGMGIDSVWTAVSTRRFVIEGDADLEPYAVLTENTATDGTVTPSPHRAATENGFTLTFYYDNKKAERNGMSVGPFDNYRDRGWYSQCENISAVVFDASFANCTTITSTGNWFNGCTNMTTITGISNLKTESITDMNSMFMDCSSLTSIDLSGFNTVNVTDMSGMFYGCKGLTSLDISGFKTDNVTNMRDMFVACEGLTSLDISGFKTDNVTNMGSMFRGCSGLTSLDLSSFRTENVIIVDYMFAECSSLTSLDLSGFNTAKVKNSMEAMFRNCSSLTSLNLSGFNTSTVLNMGSMFNRCSSLTELDLSNFNTANVTSMTSMFEDCSKLVTIYVGDEWSTNSLQSGLRMFYQCESLVGGMGTVYDPSHIDQAYAHIDGGTSNPGYLTDKNATTSFFFARVNVKGEGEVSVGSAMVRDVGEVEIEAGRPLEMFFFPDDGYQLGALYVNGSDMTQGVLPATAFGAASFTMQNVTSDLDIIVEFTPASTVVDEPEPYVVLSSNDTVIGENEGNGTTMTFYYDDQRSARQGMPMGEGGARTWDNYAESVTSLVFDPSFANCTTITTTHSWFETCNKLTTITGLEYLNTTNVTDMSEMFYECSSLKVLDLSSLNTENVTDMSMMFQNCYALEELNLSRFNTSKVTSFFQMFLHCESLESLDVSHFNTENARTMRWMFGDCFRLKSLDLSNFNTANVEDMGEMFYVCYSLTNLDLSNFNTENLTNTWGMFRYCSSLVNINISNFNTSKVTNNANMFDGCSSLASIEAGSAAIPDSVYAQVDNPNLLVYVNDESLAPSNVTNVVVNGFAKNIVLVDAKEGNNNFYAPQSFTAEIVNYTREFSQETTNGVSRGWEAIALPFDVQTITHEKWGAIAPFNNDQSPKHFWLRQLGDRGLFSATRIEANVPYVISMPNDANTYPEEFLLAGRVTFSSENVTVPKTELKVMSLADESIIMVPAFQRVSRSSDVWAINVGQARSQYYEGSVFERDYREVRPFEAYTVHRGQSPAPRFVPVSNMMGETTGISDALLYHNEEIVNDKWYTIDGRKLQGKPTQKGVYITNGEKVVIK